MNPSAAQKHLYYTEMAKLLEAGFGIRQAISVILETKPPAQQAAMLREMDAGLAQGKSIAEAFGSSGHITDLERSIVSAGERGRQLGQAFRHLADYFQLLAKARRDAVQSMIYPIALVHLGVLVTVIAKQIGVEQPKPGGMLVSGLVAFGILYLGLLVVGFLGRMVLKAAPNNASVDRWLNRIPIIGGARRSMAMARFTKVYHTGVLAGLAMKETMARSLTASNSGIIREAGVGLMARAEEGVPLGPEFMKSGAFPAAFARSYATAEEAGGLDKDLERWAAVYQDDAARGAKAVSIAIPKVLYAVVVVYIVWVIFGAYMNYLNMLDHIGEEE